MFDCYINYHARQKPHVTAIRCAHTSLNYSQFDTAIDAVCRKISDLRLSYEDVVSVGNLHPVKHWIVLLALSRIGVASACMADTKATFRISGVPSTQNPGNSLLASREWFSKSAAGRESRAIARPDPDALGRVLLSSGTTGRQKRIGLTWEMIDRNVRNAVVAYGPVTGGAWHFEVPTDSVFGFTVPIAAWACGQTVSVRESKESLIPHLQNGPPGFLAVVPFVLRGILSNLPADFEPVPRMKVVSTGGPLSKAMARDARVRLSPDLRTVYGASECSVATILDASRLDVEPKAAGYPMPGVTVDIVDDKGRGVATGEQGRVRIKSTRVVGRYLDDDEPSAAFRDGWFYPGDLGRLLDDGLLLIEGRDDDVLNIGGVKIVAGAVEDLVRDLQGVVDVAAFAMPTDDGIDQFWLALVVGEDFDQDAMVSRIVSALPYTPPMRAIRLDRLPRNGMGKVQRSSLVDEVRRRHALRIADPA